MDNGYGSFASYEILLVGLSLEVATGIAAYAVQSR